MKETSVPRRYLMGISSIAPEDCGGHEAEGAGAPTADAELSDTESSDDPAADTELSDGE